MKLRPKNNWLHLDLKGAIPNPEKMRELLHFWKECGYDGVVLEYDDRIPWKAWPGTWRGGYTLEEQQDLVRTCADLGLEVIPLIQVIGHLEWLLKHEEWRDWRENGSGNEICPLHPEALPRLKQWIDEVVELHPGIRFLHLGADETWNLGTCGKCRKHDPMKLYQEHVSELCRHALEKGCRPLIWADMFWNEKRLDLVPQLPEGTIPVDWQYNGIPPYESTEKLMQCGREIMGASGAMIGWWEHCFQVQSEPSSRIRNVTGWYKWAAEHGTGVIHTTWTRGASLWNIYGPWHGAYPAFVAGGDPARWESHPWRTFMEELSDIMLRNQVPELQKAAEELPTLPAASPLEKEVLRWLNLAVRYQALQQEFLIHRATRRTLTRVSDFVGRDDGMFRKNCVEPFRTLLPKADEWEKEARSFWQDNGLSDAEEFMATHIQLLREDIAGQLEPGI